MSQPKDFATTNAKRRASVFISYHRETGTEFAQQLMPALTQAGHEHWIDTLAIKGGQEWINEIVAGIKRADVLLVLVSPEALGSRWVQREIEFAEQKGKYIIPCLLQQVTPEDFFRLNNYQGVRFVGRAFDHGFDDLLRALQALPLSGHAPTHSAQREAELVYLDRLALEELVNADKYTPLSGASQQQVRRAEMRAVFALMKLSQERKEFTERRRFENAVAEIRDIRRAVLLGEPGGGKTTTLWKLAAELVAEALTDRAKPIPLLIRLGRWTEAEQPLAEFIAGQLGELGAYLDVLLREKRAALLLDGLNELPASQQTAKYPQVQRFIEQQSGRHPQLLAVVSCRELDYTIDLEFDRINIMPLDPLRIREFVGHYLNTEKEPDKGEALFWKLAGETAAKTHAEFMRQLGHKLAEPERVFWIDAHVPEDTTNAGWGWTKDRDYYWREWIKDRKTPSSLMVLARNPYMLLMLTSVYAEQDKLPDNRGELFQLFVQTLLTREHIPADEQAALTDGLARVAFEMQTRRTPQAEDDEEDDEEDDDEAEKGDALTVLPKAEVTPILNDRLLYLAGSASLLSVGEQVRFTHQLLQEYFAARCMDSKLRAHELAVGDLWPPERWWQRTNWEEAAILLAGLYSNDCTPVVNWVAQGNAEVAAQCIVRSGAALADAARARLRTEWIYRLTDLPDDPQPQSRAAVGRALGLTGWDNRQGVGTVRDARGVALPDIVWVEIPGGEFLYQGEGQKLTLPTFFISRYPITYAQFQTFLDDPMGYADARWFAGLAAGEQDRQMQEQSFKFANHPRETVNWYQAMAFCRWLSWRWGGGFDLQRVDEWAVRLPTEFEWEKAARGPDGRSYPYGNDFDATKGNTYETGIRQTSAVGIFPHGASPYGVEEMSGNVWEWCLSESSEPQQDARKENLGNENRRVLRGGSWFHSLDYARAVYRYNYRILPASRYSNFGFRVVVVSPPS